MELRELRRVYARQMLTIASASGNERLEEAFACVPREKFLGPAGWRILTPWSPLSYIRERDPALVYQDVVVALDEERGVNNGSPSLHARWLHLVSPREGEKVAHIGAGTGYYSAILSELVGPDGRVTAIEYDAALAERARENLSDRENVDVVHDNGCGWPKEPTDVVYVNFAIPHPAAPWIENLAMGGRLIFPLGVPRTTRVDGQTLNADRHSGNAFERRLRCLGSSPRVVRFRGRIRAETGTGGNQIFAEKPKKRRLGPHKKSHLEPAGRWCKVLAYWVRLGIELR